MADLTITNCHIHTFTEAHVPPAYPAPALAPLKALPGLLTAIGGALRLLGQEEWSDRVIRLSRFQETGGARRQREILKLAMRQYPRGTRFVVLPMDMDHIGFGSARRDLRAQQDELAALAADPEFEGLVIPFATLFPENGGSVAEGRRAIERLGFRGLKLYPRLGFAPDHPVLMEEIYPMLLERGLPVISHCSRGGVKGRHVTRSRADRWTDPRAFLPVLERFPELRVCLAHFGGQRDWRRYINDGVDPSDRDARERNWLASILDLLRSGDWPGLWTDISYTIFDFDDCIPFLKVFSENERILSRTLFGSDFYMTRQKRLSERAVSVRLRTALGEDTFRRIAETNPAIWLGERAA